MSPSSKKMDFVALLSIALLALSGCSLAIQNELDSHACEPTSDIDVPDPEFLDANCDGIDGDPEDAIFVSPTGDDDNEGSRSQPMRTIDAALLRAEASRRDYVIADRGVYADSVHLLDGIYLYGGYDSVNGWSRASQNESWIRSDRTAVYGQGLTDVHVEWFSFEIEAAGPGESAIGMVFADSNGVMFTHGELRVGDGGQGADGLPFASAATSGSSGAPGNAPTSSTGPANPGGDGGSSVCGCGAGGTGTHIYFLTGREAEPSVRGESGDSDSCAERLSGTWADPGGEGSTGAPALATSVSMGSFDASGYLPAGGLDGESGGPGGGGNGGWGSVGTPPQCPSPYVAWRLLGASGGGGGSGGCGGAGGRAGAGGGATVGVLATSSSITLADFDVETGVGGAGGDGGSGQDGGLGGLGGEGMSGSADCPGDDLSLFAGGPDGGTGGVGGVGGAGSGGPGGPSVAFAMDSSSTVDRSDDVTVSLGMGGMGGGGPGNPGPTGDELQAFSF